MVKKFPVKPDPEVRAKVYPHDKPHPHTAPRTRTAKPHLLFLLGQSLLNLNESNIYSP